MCGSENILLIEGMKCSWTVDAFSFSFFFLDGGGGGSEQNVFSQEKIPASSYISTSGCLHVWMVAKFLKATVTMVTALHSLQHRAFCFYF